MSIKILVITILILLLVVYLFFLSNYFNADKIPVQYDGFLHETTVGNLDLTSISCGGISKVTNPNTKQKELSAILWITPDKAITVFEHSIIEVNGVKWKLIKLIKPKNKLGDMYFVKLGA
jgi:hypothetical protein